LIFAADYPLLDVIWTMLFFFLWVAWFFLLFRVIGDIFRRDDIGGGTKTLWMIVVLFLPFLGVFIYVIAHGDSLAKRDQRAASARQAEMDDYVRSVATTASPVADIDRAKALLDAGTITQAEFEALKAKALA
jgi:hypothetical protein